MDILKSLIKPAHPLKSWFMVLQDYLLYALLFVCAPVGIFTNVFRSNSLNCQPRLNCTQYPKDSECLPNKTGVIRLKLSLGEPQYFADHCQDYMPFLVRHTPLLILVVAVLLYLVKNIWLKFPRYSRIVNQLNDLDANELRHLHCWVKYYYNKLPQQAKNETKKQAKEKIYSSFPIVYYEDNTIEIQPEPRCPNRDDAGAGRGQIGAQPPQPVTPNNGAAATPRTPRRAEATCLITGQDDHDNDSKPSRALVQIVGDLIKLHNAFCVCSFRAIFAWSQILLTTLVSGGCAGFLTYFLDAHKDFAKFNCFADEEWQHVYFSCYVHGFTSMEALYYISCVICYVIAFSTIFGELVIFLSKVSCCNTCEPTCNLCNWDTDVEKDAKFLQALSYKQFYIPEDTEAARSETLVIALDRLREASAASFDEIAQNLSKIDSRIMTEKSVPLRSSGFQPDENQTGDDIRIDDGKLYALPPPKHQPI